VDKEVSIPTVNDKRIAAHIPVIDNSKRGDRHLLARRLRARRHLHLPDKTLTTTRKVVTHQGEQVLDCDVRPFNMRGCPKEPACKILRSIYEDACDVAHLLAGTEVFERSRHDRKRVEMLCPSTASEFLRIGRLRCADHLSSGVRRRVSPLRPETSATNWASSGVCGRTVIRLASLAACPGLKEICNGK
jgi:hypothetical protein